MNMLMDMAHSAASLLKAHRAAPQASLSSVKSWGYQLQNVEPREIRASTYDLIVIDGITDRARVLNMKERGEGLTPRLILRYVSIGEAENYRSYWRSGWRPGNPEWLRQENRDWQGCYAVNYWDPEWQDICLKRIDETIAAGYDGVYLDKVDEFELLGHEVDMIAFVAKLAGHARSQHPGFLVVPQNGQQLTASAQFVSIIDGFAREDFYYGEDGNGVANTLESVSESIVALNRIKSAGKPVFVVEYISAQRAQTCTRIRRLGYIPHIAVRDLDKLS